MYELKLNAYQMRVVANALDLYARIGILQLEAVVNLFRTDDRLDVKEIKEFEKLVNTVKQSVFKISPNACHGISHPDVDEVYRVALDINMAMEHQLWKDKSDSAIFSVHSSPPFVFGRQPLVEIKNNQDDVG